MSFFFLVCLLLFTAVRSLLFQARFACSGDAESFYSAVFSLGVGDGTDTRGGEKKEKHTRNIKRGQNCVGMVGQARLVTANQNQDTYLRRAEERKKG